MKKQPRQKSLTGISTVLIAGCVFAAAPARACTCAAPRSPDEAWQRSAAVFKGRVTGINRPFLDRLGLTRSGTHQVTFQILKQWKGAPAKNAVVDTRLTGEACGFPFEPEKEYLVYVVTEPKEIQTGICTGTKKINEAAEDMRQLNKLSESKSP